tara:strand:+ start:365 stop:535 length:171 start_codon:yes stop_codon:yes gene_type:complete
MGKAAVVIMRGDTRFEIVGVGGGHIDEALLSLSTIVLHIRVSFFRIFASPDSHHPG